MIPRILLGFALVMLLLGYGLAAIEPAPLTIAAAGRPLVVLDPGHGGIDPGAVAHGVLEKSINLPVSIAAGEALQSGGVAVVLTRRQDRPALAASRFIVVDDLRYRAWLARHLGASLFVSIHANSEPTGTVSGPIMYYIAGRVPSYQLAQDLARAFGILFGKTPQIRPIRQLVLLETPVPAATVEVGFVTHHLDVRRLTTPAYQQVLGQAIARGVLTYLHHA